LAFVQRCTDFGDERHSIFAFVPRPACEDAPDLKFRDVYRLFRQKWKVHFGWDLFLPLHDTDSHLMKTLRVPLSESRVEFEQQVLTLAKLVVDSLNEAEISKLLATDVADEKGIGKLERWLSQEGFDARQVTETLRRIQSLRSKMSAHRKGSDFDKFLSNLGISDSPLIAVANLLWEAIAMLETMAAFFGLDLTY